MCEGFPRYGRWSSSSRAVVRRGQMRSDTWLVVVSAAGTRQLLCSGELDTTRPTGPVRQEDLISTTKKEKVTMNRRVVTT